LDVVVADGNVQAVVISTPHFEHAPLSIAAARPVPGTEGRRSLEIARGAYLSMQRGQVVAFPVKG
jgi:hypothetical protein